MQNIVVYAEKPDVAYKIAVAFGGVQVSLRGIATNVTMDNYEQCKGAITRKYSSQGYVPVNYNGNLYNITWGTGHMCSLKQAQDYNPDYSGWSKIPKPFFPDKYEIKIREGYNPKTKRTLKVDPSAKTQLAIVKKLFNDCDYIINATDDDREGELIFAYVYEYLKCKKPYKRVFLASFTEDAIRDTFTKLRDMSEVKSIEMAGRARNIADWVVGANLTVASTLQFANAISQDKKQGVISVGRVQTPTLKILVDRENEIRNFKPSTSYYIESKFTTTDGTNQSYVGSADNNIFKNKLDAEKLIKNLQKEQGTVIIYNRKDKYRQVPLLYNLSSLSIDANRAYGITAKETLDIAQDLYTSGYLTYPRTSSCYLPDDMKDTVHTILDNLGKTAEFSKYVAMVPKAKRSMTKRHFDSTKVESHYAIIPTVKIPDLSKLNKKQKDIYTLVAQSVIRLVFPPAKVQSTNIETKLGDIIFYTSGNVILEKNWLEVNMESNKEDELPVLKVGDKVLPNDIFVKDKTTRAPSRYTDSSLLAAMVSAGKNIEDKDLRSFMSLNGDGGIGTEATRAGIIETVISRKYAKRQDKYIVPTEKGMRLIEVLPIEDLKSPELTAKWEGRLNDIQENKDTLENFISDLEKQTNIWVKEVLKTNMESSTTKNTSVNTGVKCPHCGADIIENDYGFFCSANVREDSTSCQFKLFKASERFKFNPDMDVEDLKSLVNDGKTRVKSAISKKGNSYQFVHKLSADKQSTEMELVDNNRNTDFLCPVCGEHLVHIKNDAKKWDFYSCRGHVIIGADFFGTPLSDDNIRDLLDGKKVGPLDMHYKDGTAYEGYLRLDMSEGKVKKVSE